MLTKGGNYAYHFVSLRHHDEDPDILRAKHRVEVFFLKAELEEERSRRKKLERVLQERNCEAKALVELLQSALILSPSVLEEGEEGEEGEEEVDKRLKGRIEG